MANVKDTMIRSTAGSNTDKWSGKKYKGKRGKIGQKPKGRVKLTPAQLRRKRKNIQKMGRR
jgi:hypothetical protein